MQIFKADFELRKIMTNGQRTEDQEIKTDTLVMGNANLEMRVKGEPHYFKDFIPGTLITVSFTQSQTSMADFDKKQDEGEQDEEEQDEEEKKSWPDYKPAKDEEQALPQSDGTILKDMSAEEEGEDLEGLDE